MERRRDVNFRDFFSRVENLNSRELDRCLDRYLSSAHTDSKKNYGRHCVELRTGMAAATSSNILIPSAHSIDESLSQVPGHAVRMS